MDYGVAGGLKEMSDITATSWVLVFYHKLLKKSVKSYSKFV